jgi:hypothetical protein
MMSVRCPYCLANYCNIIRLQQLNFCKSARIIPPRRKAGCYGTSDVLQTRPRASYEAVFTHFDAFSRLSAQILVIRSLCSNTLFCDHPQAIPRFTAPKPNTFSNTSDGLSATDVDTQVSEFAAQLRHSSSPASTSIWLRRVWLRWITSVRG